MGSHQHQVASFINIQEYGDENVEKLNIDATEAHKRFKGKNVQAGNIDFSDRVSKHRRTGYDIPDQTEYELVINLTIE